jgi:hypothetical protein
LTYHGTLHHGRLVTVPPISDDQPVRVIVSLLTDDSDAVVQPVAPFDFDAPELLKLRELLSGVEGLSDDIISERRGEV